MARIQISGGHPLEGTVEVSGAKNAVLPILMSALLTGKPCRLTGVPHLKDVTTTIELLGHLGVVVSLGDDGAVSLDAGDLQGHVAPYDLVKTMRASILVLGPLLARTGEAKVSLPGGCAIGARPVNLHLDGLQALGAQVNVEAGYIHAWADRLKGARIVFDTVTVTGTENLLMAACLAEGTSVIENAAQEPEVVDLAECLISMGAHISGHGSNTITVEGQPELAGFDYRVVPDRIEAGTFLVGAAMTGGRIRAVNAAPQTMDAILAKLEDAGAQLSTGPDWIELDMRGQRPRAVNIATAPYPGFPTDMQAQFTALNSIAEGTGVVRENVFENRFMHVQELQRLACLVLAGLVADGDTIVDRVYHIDRGYENIEEKLRQLGASIRRLAI